MRTVREIVNEYFYHYEHYYTDGKRFYRKPSYRKIVDLKYVGCFETAKEAKKYFLKLQNNS